MLLVAADCCSPCSMALSVSFLSVLPAQQAKAQRWAVEQLWEEWRCSIRSFALQTDRQTDGELVVSDDRVSVSVWKRRRRWPLLHSTPATLLSSTAVVPASYSVRCLSITTVFLFLYCLSVSVSVSIVLYEYVAAFGVSKCSSKRCAQCEEERAIKLTSA